jgi:fatty-acyl-CoA synthase
MYIGDYLARRELYSPEKLAFIDAGKTPEWRLTYREANRRANKLANWLKSQGIGKGDRVALLARDGYEHLDLFFACGRRTSPASSSPAAPPACPRARWSATA